MSTPTYKSRITARPRKAARAAPHRGLCCASLQRHRLVQIHRWGTLLASVWISVLRLRWAQFRDKVSPTSHAGDLPAAVSPLHSRARAVNPLRLMRAAGIGVVLAWLLLMAAPARAGDEIPCFTWCQQCDPGPGCTADCLIQNQPMRAAGCVPSRAPTSTPASRGIPCYDWCAKCKPADTACPSRCDKQGKPLMTRSCPAR